MNQVERSGASQALVKARPSGADAPPAHWALGHLPEMKKDILGFYTKCERQYGPAVPLRIAVVPFLLVNDPALIQRVLVTDQAKYIKPTAFKMVKPMFGDGLLTSEGDFWRSQRALIQPFFHKQCIDGYGDVVMEHTAAILAAWKENPARDIYEDLTELTLNIVAGALFSGSDVEAGKSAVVAAARGVQDFFLAWRRHYLLAPSWVPLPANIRLRRAVRETDRAIYGLIAARQASGERGRDMMSVLLEATHSDGSKVSPRALRDELVTMFIAGHETSAVAISWGLYELVKNPHVAEKLRFELDSVLGDRDANVDDLPHLPYLDQVVKETMRLYPSAYNIGRVAKVDTEVGEYKVRAGQNVIMSQWAVQRSFRHYDEPDAFVPERWETERARTMPKFAYFPFSGGPRNCIGAQFALLESKLILGAFVRNFDVTLEPGAAIGIDAALTLRPAQGMRMQVAPRKQVLVKRHVSGMRPTAGGACPVHIAPQKALGSGRSRE
jgi:cytochrome P450